MKILAEVIAIWKEIEKLLKDEKVLKMSSTVFLTSLFTFCCIKILAYYDILSPMMNIIKEVLIWTMVFTSSFMAASLLVNYSERLLKERANKMAKQKSEQEAQAKNEILEKEITNLLSSLSAGEVAIMKYVLNCPNGAVWLPVENIDVLSLYSRKCLFSIWNASSLRGVFPSLEQCFAYSVPEVIRNYYKERGEELKEIWGDVPEATDMEIFN